MEAFITFVLAIPVTRRSARVDTEIKKQITRTYSLRHMGGSFEDMACDKGGSRVLWREKGNPTRFTIHRDSAKMEAFLIWRMGLKTAM